jgi:membrane associated rhomboid family serine protease
MTEPQLPPGAYDQVPVCPRHPDRESWVRCQRCGRPTCPECQRPAAVGIQCVDCVAAAARASRPTVTRFGGRAVDGRPIATYTLIGICVVVYVVQLARPSVTAAFAFQPARGWHEPWRALTAAFLHSPSMFLHIVLNMVFLWQIGPYLEGLLGRARFVALYLVSAIGASVSVVLLAPAPTSVLTSPAEAAQYAAWGTWVVGASGAVFGLFGALFVLNRRMGRSSAALYAVLIVNAVIGFLYPGISWQAHLGGLLTGAAGAAVIARLSSPPLRRWQLPALGLLLLLLVAAAAFKYLAVPDIYR